MLFFTTLVIQLCNGSIGPILALFIKSMAPDSNNIAFLAGMIAAVPGVSALISAPRLGKLGDRIGTSRILLATLCCAVVMFFACWLYITQRPQVVSALIFLIEIYLLERQRARMARTLPLVFFVLSALLINLHAAMCRCCSSSSCPICWSRSWEGGFAGVGRSFAGRCASGCCSSPSASSPVSAIPMVQRR